jgi:hypothetical protein
VGDQPLDDEARHALILDDETACLGPAALQLIRMGIDVYYAKDPDEASLLCRQPEVAAAARALVFPESVAGSAVCAIARRLGQGPRSHPLGLVAVGELEDEDRCAALRKAGVTWVLRTPYDESTLRWVVNAAMCPFERGGSRNHVRVPTSLLARAFLGQRRKDLLLSTLSVGGAFLETPLPFPIGTQLRLEIPLPEGPVEVRALVGHRAEAGEAGRRGFPSGMGVLFETLPPATRDAIARFVAQRERHFRV